MIALLRSTDGNPDSRFEKYVDFLQSNNIDFYTLCWDRYSNKSETSNKRYFKLKAEYSKRYKNLSSLILFNIYLFKELKRLRKSYKVIHACDFDTIIPAILMRIIYHKKVIYDIFDWYIDSRGINGIIKYILLLCEYVCIKLSSAVIICESERRKQIIFTPKRLWVLPNIPNFKDKLPTITNNEYLVISYVGILGPGRGLNHLFNYAKQHPNVKIKVAGFGPLESLFKEKNDNIQFFGTVSYKQALEIMNSADIIMAIYEKTNKNQILAAPNKYYEGLYLAKPIITTTGTLIGDRTIKYNTGYAIDENYTAFENLIDNLSLEDIKIKAKNAQLLWDSKFSTYVTDFLNTIYLPFLTVNQ